MSDYSAAQSQDVAEDAITESAGEPAESDELDDLGDLEFLLEDIENRIAPLA